MAKGGGGGRAYGLFRGGSIRVGNIRVGDQVLSAGYPIRRDSSGYLVTKLNQVSVGISTGGARGRISRSDLIGGYAFRNGRWVRLRA